MVAVVACSGLAQFVLYTTWVLYTTFKFGWGPLENGWSLAAVGIVSAVVQGLLLGRILKRVSPRKLAVLGLMSSALAYVLWGAATQSWMMFAIIFVNLLGAGEDGHRVVYAESIFDEAGADGLLATLLTDRRLSLDFFADERRLERDVLADGAEARLLELFGH